MTLLHKIITDGNNRCYRITNADGKSWLLPAKNMRVALGLYQPSGRNGKLLKALFPWLHSLPLVRKVIKAETLHCTLQEELQEILQKVFGTKELEFAIFEGTPCVHQKITMQLSLGKKILGYCKASDNKEILSLFEKETSTLEQLAKQGVTNIPKPLYCGTMDNGVHIFVQSTEKSTESGVIHQWSSLQENFIATLHEKTKQQLPFEESDYYHSIIALQEHLDWLPAHTDRRVVATAIAGVMAEYSGKIVEFSAFHGDFTPWNMFTENNKLFVFDFEYSALTYPANIDKCHFLMQTAIYKNNWDAKKIAKTYITNQNKQGYKQYFLSVLSQYIIREKGIYNPQITTIINLWIQILSMLK